MNNYDKLIFFLCSDPLFANIQRVKKKITFSYKECKEKYIEVQVAFSLS